MDYTAELLEKGSRAKQAARKLATLSSIVKNQVLYKMAEALEDNNDAILAANELDMAGGREKGLTAALLDRLLLNKARISAMADGLRTVAALPDPIGTVISGWRHPRGLEITKLRVPLGVIGIIYEARPNVTADAAGLCLKAGNAVILRGGTEAIQSNMALARVMAAAATAASAPENAIQLVESTDRAAVNGMLKLNQYLDVIIPRGGAGLIKTVLENGSSGNRDRDRSMPHLCRCVG